MKLEKKIPPPIVAGLFALLTYVSSLSGSHLFFLGQAILSLVILIIALAIMIIANIQFKRADTTINPMKPETTSALVTTGLFGHSRNPMYLAMALALGSFSIYLGSWLGFLAVPAFIQYINRFQIIPEEEAMQSLFGEAFTDYCKSVRRWI